MLTFFLDRRSKKPLYEQLYKEIKQLIESNVLPQNTKLPSKRKLANHLKISQTTIETAYQQLLDEGYIKSIPKVGFFVAGNFETFVRTEKPSYFNYEKKIETEYLIDFKTNQVDTNSFPYDRLAKIERDIILDKLKENLNRGDIFGVYEFRKKISEILYSYRGIKAKPEQIVVASGSEHLLLLLIMLLGRDKTYAVEDPTYLKNYQLYQVYGVRVMPVELDDEGIKLNELRKAKADIVHTTPSHQFPTGLITSVTRRLELLAWANEDDNRYIIEDDYDSEFRFFGNPVPAMKGLDGFDKVIYLNSFSKSIAPSFRISFMVLPENLIERYHQSLSFFSSSVATINQLVLERFIDSGEYEKHLNRMKNIYKTKRDYLISCLSKSLLKDKIVVHGEEAGLHFLVEVKTISTEAYLLEMAKDKGIRVYGLSEYSISKCILYENPTIVFGYSNLSLDELARGVDLLGEAWKNI